MNVPFHKPYITKDEIDAVNDVLNSGWLTMGPKTIAFEKKFKKYIGSKHAISVNSCTAALHLALNAIGLQEGDEVLVPSFTFTATAEVICYFKAKPIFIDIDRDTHTIDINLIEEHITDKTKAIIPVHYGGQPCDMQEICELAKMKRLFVIEDAAHSLPAWYNSNKIGTIGDMTCFSFYATKTLSCGEGGMVTTNNNDWADNIKSMRLHGISQNAWKRYSEEGSWNYEVLHAGYKYNMTDIQAALGIVQLSKLEWMWKKRKQIAEQYTKNFKDLEAIIVPYIKNDRETSWHLYPIKLNLEVLKIDRNTFINKLSKKGIKTSVHFIPLYKHPFYRDNFRFNPLKFPNSEWVFDRIVSLPIFPSMTGSQIDYIIEKVKYIVKKYKK